MKRFVNERLSRKSIQELVYEYLHFENGYELSANAFLKDARKPLPNTVLKMDENKRTLTNILNDHHKISLKVLKQVEELPEHLQTYFESKMPVSKQVEILFEILKSGHNTEIAETQMFNSSAIQTEVLAGFQTSCSNIRSVLRVPAVIPEKTDENINTDNTLDISYAKTEILDEDDRNISDFEPTCDNVCETDVKLEKTHTDVDIPDDETEELNAEDRDINDFELPRNESSQEVADDFGGSTFVLDKFNRAEVGNNLLPEIADDMLELENRPTEINNIEGREIPASRQKSDLYLGFRQCSVPLNNIMNHINFRLVESDIYADVDIKFINNGRRIEAASTNKKHEGLKRIRNESLGEISVKKQKFGDEGVASCSYAMKRSRRHLKENKLKKMSEEADTTRRRGLKISKSRKCEACL